MNALVCSNATIPIAFLTDMYVMIKMTAPLVKMNIIVNILSALGSSNVKQITSVSLTMKCVMAKYIAKYLRMMKSYVLMNHVLHMMDADVWVLLYIASSHK